MSTGSTSSIAASTVNGTTRVPGLVSGIDVESIVEQSMMAERARKYNPLQQKEQLAEWRQDAYRDITSDIQDFGSEYFSTTGSNSLLVQSNYQRYNVSSDNSAVSASYSSDASPGTHQVEVEQLATAATLTSSNSISKEVSAAQPADYAALNGKSFVVTLDGTARTVNLTGVTDASSLQQAIDAAVGQGKLVAATDANGCLTITAAEGSGVQTISLSNPSSGNGGLASLGFTADAVVSNRLDTNDTLEKVAGQLGEDYSGAFQFNADGEINLSINGVEFTFDKSDTLDSMMKEINSSKAGASMKYDELSGKLTLTAKETGAGNTLTVTETGSTFASTLLSVSTAGQDALVTIDGQSLTRSSNTFTVDGVNYTLNAVTEEDESATISLQMDSDAVYDMISSFVEDYNKLIDTVSSKLSEDYDRDYPPLTDDQKAEMSDDEIAQWEQKAKTGLLENDSTLDDFLNDMRSALIDPISGSSTTIFDLGFDTGSWEDEGKLIVDESALRSAIEQDPDKVMNLFAKSSSSYPGTTTVRTLDAGELSVRYQQEGIAYRFYDTLQKYTSTIRDNDGQKGLLLEMAGIENDASDTDNTLSKQIAQYEEQIDNEQERLDDYEDSLYNQYSQLETYINNMNTQLTALQSYLSS